LQNLPLELANFYLFLRQGFPLLPRLALNPQSSYFFFLSAGITDMHHHTRLVKVLLQKTTK
jgi:hypothetical protein